MKSSKFLRAHAALAILIVSQLACQALTSVASPEPAPTQIIEAAAPPTGAQTEASPAETSFTDDEIKAGIQESLDTYAEAYNTNDLDLLASIVDSENKPFFRIVTSRFTTFQESYLGGSTGFKYTLLDIQKREFGFVLAHFETRGGSQANWLFRFTGDRWVLSEPTVEQVGEPIITETEHFIFTSYPWADDVNPQIMELMETARNNVEKVLGKVPDEKASVKIIPIYGVSPFNPMNAIALYMKERGPLKDIIEVYAPYSFAFSFYDPSLGWDGDLLTTLTHEYTHMAHARSFDQSGRLSDWMSEGLAEYVSAPEYNIINACEAYNSGTIIPILDESGAVYTQDLMHLTVLDQNVRLGYDYAQALVKFNVENHGGLDGFWKLANALDETSDFKKAVQSAFGISYEQYDKEWQAWLKKQC
jgi:hypothetical protein